MEAADDMDSCTVGIRKEMGLLKDESAFLRGL